MSPSAENWDDDFEFTDVRKPPPPEPRHLHWDADPSITRLGTTRLDSWAEPGPSTPTKHVNAHTQAENWDDDFEDKGDSPPGRRYHHAHRASHHTLQYNHHSHPLRTRHSYHTPPRPKARTEPENWDDDFDDPSSSTSPVKTDNDNTPVTKRTRREAYADTSDEEDFGFSDDKEEDKTVTARSRTAPMIPPGSSNATSPVPALPRPLSPSLIEPFPRSPTVSVFSIPTTSGRDSLAYFNSTSHLVLSGAASTLGMLPPSPPQRERRRLRKKSRPPNMDNNVFELIEEPLDSSPPPLPPSTPERERASSPPIVPMMHVSSLEATPSGGSKTPLLSRIGSVTKWGVRRKRASTGPAEVVMPEVNMSSGAIVEADDTPRPPSALDQAQAQSPSSRHRHANVTRSGWFFRSGGAHYGAGSPPPGIPELKHEKSLDHARLRPGFLAAGGRESVAQPLTAPTTPIKSGRLTRRKASGAIDYTTSSSDLAGEASSGPTMGLGKPSSLGPSRRPTSMQVPNGASLALGMSSKFGSVGTRHASYGSSVGRASATRVFSTPTPSESAEDLPPMPVLPLPLSPQQQDGSRGFMGSVRKISLVGGKKHKRRKSSIEVAQIPPVPVLQDDNMAEDRDGTGERDADTDADEDTGMETGLRVRTPDLLPPIELHPPSPPRPINGVSAHTISMALSDGTEPMIPSISAPASTTIPSTISPTSSPVAATKSTPKSPGSPQSASLGRTTQPPNPPPSNATIPRRNSLGDLKIPARISQAQIGLKRDLGMVREFATSIDKLKELQSTYYHLITEVQTFLECAPPSRATSPSAFALVRPRSRLRSNTSPPSNPTSFSKHKHVAAALHAISVKYRISWECAELLIELGGGTPYPTSPPTTGTEQASHLSAPMQAELDRRKNRERAVTLSGEESKPPAASAGAATASTATAGPPESWRASTGRHDLSQRQLVLLRDMLSSGELPPDEIPPVEEYVNRNWRWGDGMNSTLTLPSEESDPRGAAEHAAEGLTAIKSKKRRGTRMGLTGLRDMLRMLKRNHAEQQQQQRVVVTSSPSVTALPVASTASLSTESSHFSHHHYLHGQVGVGQRPATSAGAESVRSTNSPYGGPVLHHKTSPRRPSLASIFRIGQKSRNAGVSGSGSGYGSGVSAGMGTSSAGESSQDSRSDVRSASRGSNLTGDEEDWDRIESAIDLDGSARALGIEGTATIKGRKGRPSPFSSEHLQLAHAAGLMVGHGHRPVTPHRGQQDGSHALRFEVEASPRSIRPMRSTRLSNVAEVEDGEREGTGDGSLAENSKTKNGVSLHRTSRPSSRSGASAPGSSGRTGSVRSTPPQPLVDDGHGMPEIKLSMTPENIRPLLENAREVHVRCHDCIRELRALLDTVPVVVASPVSVG